MMEVKMINPASLNKPQGYAHAMLVSGGKMLYIAGQVPWTQAGRCVAPGDIVKQFEQTMSNLQACCKEVGAKMTDIVLLRIFVTDKKLYKAHNKDLGAIYQRYFGRYYPAITLVQIVELWDEQNMVEIEAMAVLPA
ncbi:MAG: RidA family protein [Candidatus Tectomicrobia bacterium]|nr:RidA family protein [Candidatus Tectomicrobia bacterium]